MDDREHRHVLEMKPVGPSSHPLQHRHVDALSVTRGRCWRSSRCAKVDKEELSQSQQAGFIYLILCTVSGVAAGLQNTG